MRRQTMRISRLSWQALEAGDIIDIVAPGFGFTKSELQKACKIIEGLGLSARYNRKILGSDVLCANSDQERYKQLAKAFKANDSKAVWCMRGGYGSHRLLGKLSRLKAPKIPKLLLGYSDIVSLHMFVNQSWNWGSLHAPVLDGLSKSSKDLKTLKGVLFGEQPDIEFQSLKAMNSSARKSRIIKSSVVGGNLTVITGSLGTPWQIDLKSKILFLEETGERAYRIDRHLQQMAWASCFKGVRAVIFGDFVGGKEAGGKSKTPEVLKRFARESSFPVLSGVPAGHGKVNKPVPLNTKATLTLGGAKASLRIQAGFKR